MNSWYMIQSSMPNLEINQQSCLHTSWPLSFLRSSQSRDNSVSVRKIFQLTATLATISNIANISVKVGGHLHLDRGIIMSQKMIFKMVNHLKAATKNQEFKRSMTITTHTLLKVNQPVPHQIATSNHGLPMASTRR